MKDKSLFFLTISLVCVWLILDNLFGEKYVNKFLNSMFDFMDSDLKLPAVASPDDDVKELGETDKFVIQKGMTDEDAEKIKKGEKATDENGKEKIIFVF